MSKGVPDWKNVSALLVSCHALLAVPFPAPESCDCRLYGSLNPK